MAESGDGELGSEPIDPLDGGGAVPPESPDPEASWPSPSTLGNGLVHDTRFNVDPQPHAATFTASELAEGVDWSSFVEGHATMQNVGFRPAQLLADVELSGDELTITDHSLYVSDDDANYRTQVQTHVFGSLADERNFDDFAASDVGARPTSIQTLSGPGFTGYSVAWVFDAPGTSPKLAWKLYAGQTKAEIVALLANSNFRPISLASRQGAGGSEYAVILVERETGDWPVSGGLDSDALADQIAAEWQTGFYPYRISAEQGDPSRVNVLWAQRAPGISVQTRLNLTADGFASQDAIWRSHGYHLETVDELAQGRRAAVWVRYEPYLRWTGSKFVPGDTTYGTRYQMFHDQAIRVLARLTDIDCSGGEPCPTGTACYSCSPDAPCFHDDVCVDSDYAQYFQPSGTLHIFEGEELVLNRAYTFGPAIYPDTPQNAPMKLASVAKSITAAAVVREMLAQDKFLTLPFATVAGVFSDYPLKSASYTARVRDVLHGWGGFASNTKTPISYADHSVIVAAGGTRPISGEEMFDYVFAPAPNGHIGNLLDSDNYWRPDNLDSSRSTGLAIYSNVGYTMLGELVRVLSGEPYEEYVRNHFATPLGLQDRLFRDPGNRFALDAPARAARNAYLVNESHPYNVESVAPVSPLTGVEGPPEYPVVLQFAEHPVWQANMGPLDPRAPARATTRYAGGAYLGSAPQAAGGWWSDGEALGILIRTISQTSQLMPDTDAAYLWHPQYWIYNHGQAANWAYGLGWYARGNWVGWMGADQGSTAVVLHNRMWDVTVVFLTNMIGFPTDFINPLMQAQAGVSATSPIGQVWPCVPDPSFAPLSACKIPIGSLY